MRFTVAIDLKPWREDKLITKAADRLREAGKTVWVTMPESIHNQKTDFNDVLKIRGENEIKDIIYKAELYGHEMKNAGDSQKTLSSLREFFNEEIILIKNQEQFMKCFRDRGQYIQDNFARKHNISIKSIDFDI